MEPAWQSRGERPPPLVLFDGDCGFCNAAVRWILAREREPVLHFAPLGGKLGTAVLAAHGLEGVAGSTLVLVEDGAPYLRSTAALRIAGYLTFPWWPLRGLLRVPQPIRDAVYDLVARIRGRLPGAGDTCSRPDASAQARLHD